MNFLNQQEQIQNGQITKTELITLLQASGSLQQQLFRQAREIRQRYHGDQVVVRGVIEISNYCQKNCNYCAMRATNQKLERYRLGVEQIFAIGTHIKEANIPIIFLQGGQDPHCDPILEEVIPRLKKELNLSVLLCLGEKPREAYQKFAELGADSYILKFETSSPSLYKNIAHTPLLRRLQCIRTLQESGFKVGTGNIVGLPNQTIDSLAEDILLALEIQPDFVSSSPFIPNQDTPLENLPYGDINLTLNTMALYRILLPSCLIPTVSALEKIQKGGQLMGLNAGANVLTINFTPAQCRDKYAIYSKQRFVVSLEHAQQTIKQAGLSSNSFKSPVLMSGGTP
ncbi:[FeFe] hydrogenase H-cluster radical SAM maturase HydE [Gloeothece verrucosa]|uniref:Radical SAM domain protein n=1 Tax=Gloeothece verrucosa (strain PCC 7822) TaxID=497965 RepID=E0U529_GLOV7|nr:[FeFe] hydrogenase H-cluster radical SAM maturase HydE [Gloeothece verrucosa]ADN12308.1 Radical SAM domain protein [Gloeothece verrucosa PCC 7822]